MPPVDASVETSGAVELTAPTAPLGRRAQERANALLTVDDVLYANELKRSALFVWLTLGLAIAGIGCAAVFTSADTTARWLLAGGCTVLLGTSLVAVWVLRDDARYSAGLAALYSYICVGCVLPAYYFFGWFSGVLLLVPLAAVSFAMGQAIKSVIGMTVATMASHAILAGLMIGEVIPDRSVSSLHLVDVEYQIAYLAMVQAMFAFSFAFGRLIKGHSVENVERYGTAVREAAKREALLQEALGELERADRAGEPGRYTGMQLGSYRVGVVLGRGGMGEVYEAEHTSSGDVAAVKVMTTAGAMSPKARARFAREIDIARSLRSPHLVRVLEYSAPDDEVMYLAMERLHGATLSAELRATPRMLVDDAIDMLRQVANGVDTAHAAGVIHRDLKPGNVFRHGAGSRTTWKVLDFGVSKLRGSSGTLTGGGVVGTPNYMSPEQASGGQVDARTDVFSLGCIAYRCLTGQPAFSGREVVDVLYAVVHHMPVRPSLVASMRHEVDVVLAIALAKDPAHRFDSCGQLVDALRAACRGSLDDEFERRGEALLALQPWDT